MNPEINLFLNELLNDFVEDDRWFDFGTLNDLDLKTIEYKKMKTQITDEDLQSLSKIEVPILGEIEKGEIKNGKMDYLLEIDKTIIKFNPYTIQNYLNNQK